MTLKVKFRTQFPAVVSASSPIVLAKAGLSYSFTFDINALRTTLDAIYLNPTLTSIILSGATSGTVTLQAPAVAGSRIASFPAASGTVVFKDTTDVLTNKTLDSAGTGNVLKVSGVTVSAGQYPGEITNGSATAGNAGEYVESAIASGSAVALVTATAKTITSISLTAGDWDIDASVYFLTLGTTSVTVIANSISATTNTMDFTVGKFNFSTFAAVVPGAVAGLTQNIPPYRLSLSATTTVFLIAQSSFTVNNNSAYGLIRARRVR